MLQLQGAQCEPSQYRYLQCAAEKHHLQLKAALTPEYMELLAARNLKAGQKNAAWVRARRGSARRAGICRCSQHARGRRGKFARRHKECCKMTYSRMVFSSRGPSSPRAAANRRDWHQASWWVMVEQWMDGGVAGCSSPRRYWFDE